jgi:hypothetical protein
LYHIFGPVCLQVTSNGVGVTLQCSNTFVCCHHVIITFKVFLWSFLYNLIDMS